MAVAAAAVVLLVLAGARWVERTRGGAEAAVSLTRAPGRGGAAVPERQRVFVHVAGAVRRPGVYSLPRGARGGDAVERAGGPRRSADLNAVNLAAVLDDGQQLVVPARGAVVGEASSTAPVPGARGGAAGPGAGGAAAGSGGGGGSVAPGAKLRLSTATTAQLEELDGIGPALAARILEYRDAQGGFRSVDELAEVEGIGDKRLESLRRSVAP